MLRFFIALVLWCILLVINWPLALLVLVAVPVVWVVWMLIRSVAVVVEAGFALLGAVLMLPARILSFPFVVGRRRLVARS